MLRRRSGQVQSVTAAPRSLRADVHSREVRYLISMGIRTACFVAAFFTDGLLRWVCVAGAFILPYFAVVIANAGRERAPQDLQPYVPLGRPELPAGGPEAPSETNPGSTQSGRTGTDRGRADQ